MRTLRVMNGAYIPACRFFFWLIVIRNVSKIMNSHRKVMKNDQFSSKKHEKSYFHEKSNLHTGVSVFCDQKMIKKQSKIMNFHSKNTIICIRSPCIFVGKIILFFDSWTYVFSIIRISFAQNRRQKWRFLFRKYLLAACWLAGWLAGYGKHSFNS